MTRVKRGNVARKKREKILQLSTGFRGSSSNLFRTANQHVNKALKSSSQSRYRKKRDFRSTWISRINAAVRQTSENNGMNYNTFIYGVKDASLAFNRKVLAQLAIKDRQAFSQVKQYIIKNN